VACSPCPITPQKARSLGALPPGDRTGSFFRCRKRRVLGFARPIVPHYILPLLVRLAFGGRATPCRSIARCCSFAIPPSAPLRRSRWSRRPHPLAPAWERNEEALAIVSQGFRLSGGRSGRLSTRSKQASKRKPRPQTHPEPENRRPRLHAAVAVT
jgi:hypothetical protein